MNLAGILNCLSAQDDLLDVFADPAIFRKDTGNDIVSIKDHPADRSTLQATLIEREKLLHWLTVTDFNRKQKIEAVKTIYEELHLEQSVNNRIDIIMSWQLPISTSYRLKTPENRNSLHFASILSTEEHRILKSCGPFPAHRAFRSATGLPDLCSKNCIMCIGE
jgi:hypothetical protein